LKRLRLLSVLLGLVLVGCGNSQTADSSSTASGSKELTKVRVVLDWTPNTNHTGLYVAKAKGYYEKAGLDVEIVQPPEDGATPLVAGGGAEFGIDFQDSLAANFSSDNPLPVTAVAAVIQHNTSGLISLKEDGIDSPAKLAGQSYATWNLPIELAIVKKVVEDDGGDFSKVKLIPSTVTDVVSALQTKSVNAIWVYYGWDGIATEKAGLETNYLNFADYAKELDYYSPVIVGNNKYMKNNPEITKAFLDATRQGYEAAIADPDAAAQILVDAVPELDIEMVKASQQWLANQYKAEVTQWGYINPERWNTFYQWLNENDLVEKPIAENVGFTNEYLPK
jgi:ABC-type nitrate/sulfonate/bicarbonate transport system substrate-binding protein